MKRDATGQCVGVTPTMPELSPPLGWKVSIHRSQASFVSDLVSPPSRAAMYSRSFDTPRILRGFDAGEDPLRRVVLGEDPDGLGIPASASGFQISCIVSRIHFA